MTESELDNIQNLIDSIEGYLSEIMPALENGDSCAAEHEISLAECDLNTIAKHIKRSDAL